MCLGLQRLSHRRECAVSQEDLHSLIAAPCDGSCRHMEQYPRPDACPECFAALRPGNVPDGVHLQTMHGAESGYDEEGEASLELHVESSQACRFNLLPGG